MGAIVEERFRHGEHVNQVILLIRNDSGYLVAIEPEAIARNVGLDPRDKIWRNRPFHRKKPVCPNCGGNLCSVDCQ
jgi:RNA polymerase subunit RPABC4/transcription elongation factor Spt4